MAQKVALFICIAFILWLFHRDRKQRTTIPSAVWIPLIWIVIVSSRPISAWFGLSPQMKSTDDYLEGSPVDAMVFLLLIVAGLLVLIRRRANWRAIIANNRWVFLFYLYLGLSAMWSDFPLVSFKRWIKDFGNVVMVLVLLSESEPIEAIRAVFARCAYLLIPLSVLLIKYYPELGRTYNPWTWTPTSVGITTNKNELGCLVLACTLFLLWDLIDIRNRKHFVTEVMTRLILLLMGIWLLYVANSVTSTTCTILGALLFLGMRLNAFKRRLNRIEALALGAALLFLALDAVFGVRGLFFESVNRDSSLTGRTDIWKLVLSANVNPLIGAGFYSFWLGSGAQILVEEGYHGLTQAHNGYVETYLNSGLIGVGLLLLLLVLSYSRVKRDLIVGGDYARLMFTFFVIGILYNFSEATFSHLTPLWLILILVVMRLPGLSESGWKGTVGDASGRMQRVGIS